VHIGQIAGLCGDVLTFAGGMLLAWDAVEKEREFQSIQHVARTLKSPWMARLKVEMNGIILVSENDVEQAFIRRSAKKAKWGCVFLAVGFGFLLVSRILET
jgi:hypothetical protein